LGFTRRKHRKWWGIVFVGPQNGGKMVGKWWGNGGNASKYGGKSIANLTLCFFKASKLAVI